MAESLRSVQLCFAPTPLTVWEAALPLEAPLNLAATTVRSVLLQLTALLPEPLGWQDIQAQQLTVSLWGKRLDLDANPEMALAWLLALPQFAALPPHVPLRFELCRPLRVDPKVARRERFAQQGSKMAGLFTTRRRGAKAGY